MRGFVYLIVFFSFFDLFSQLPVMSPFALSLGATPFLVGLAVGMYSFSNTIGNIISGFMTDKRGPFLILVLGLFASAFSLFLYSFIDRANVIARCPLCPRIHGRTDCPSGVHFPGKSCRRIKRGKSVAISGAFVGLAAIIGPAYGGIVAAKTSTPFIMAVNGGIMMLLAILAFFVLRSFTYVRKQSSEKANRFQCQISFPTSQVWSEHLPGHSF